MRPMFLSENRTTVESKTLHMNKQSLFEISYTFIAVPKSSSKTFYDSHGHRVVPSTGKILIIVIKQRSSGKNRK